MNADTRRRLRRRIGQRGAAMVEAAVSIPVFIIMFGSIVFIGNTYETKLNVMRISKESSWTSAMNNCGEPGDGTTGGIASDGPAASVGGDGSNDNGADLSQAQQAASGAPNVDVSSKGYGAAESTVTQAVAAGTAIGGYTKTMSAHTRVTCNEPAYKGKLKDFLKVVQGYIK